jgi:hypothetical protein
LSKCQFFHEKLEYLGHELSLNGIRPGQAKTKAIGNYPRPTNVHEIRQFIGFTFFFRKFRQGFAAIAKPLTVLTKTNIPFVWGQEEQAFQTLTRRLAERPVLVLYNQEAATGLHNDASMHGVGGILLQHQDETLRPICYYSRQTSKVEQHYHSYELETLAVIESMRRFRIYLLGNHFTVVTDCNALRSTMTKREILSPELGGGGCLRTNLILMSYRPGKKTAHVDALSRNSVQEEGDGCEEEHDMFHLSLNEDWVLAAQLKDEPCKLLHATLTSIPLKEVDAKNVVMGMIKVVYRDLWEDFVSPPPPRRLMLRG